MQRMRVVQVGPTQSSTQRRVRITLGPWTTTAVVTLRDAFRPGHLRSLIEQHAARVRAARRSVRR